MRDAAGVVEPLYEFGRMARRINEEVAARARDEVRVRAEGRARIEPTAPHAVGGSPAERSWLVAAAASFRCVPTRLGTRVPHARPQVVPRMSSAAARRHFCRAARRRDSVQRGARRHNRCKRCRCTNHQVRSRHCESASQGIRFVESPILVDTVRCPTRCVSLNIPKNVCLRESNIDIRERALAKRNVNQTSPVIENGKVVQRFQVHCWRLVRLRRSRPAEIDRGRVKTRRYFSFGGPLTLPYPKIIEYSAF